jgi:hypothetical protein
MPDAPCWDRPSGQRPHRRHVAAAQVLDNYALLRLTRAWRPRGPAVRSVDAVRRRNVSDDYASASRDSACPESSGRGHGRLLARAAVRRDHARGVGHAGGGSPPVQRACPPRQIPRVPFPSTGSRASSRMPVAVGTNHPWDLLRRARSSLTSSRSTRIPVWPASPEGLALPGVAAHRGGRRLEQVTVR